VCLLIHKNADAAIPAALLESAAQFNPHGYGLMAFDADGRLVVHRRAHTHLAELQELYESYRTRECVLHLRYGTSGVVDSDNTHPIRITPEIYLAHNGTVNLARRDQERSDTWHLVNDYLRPVLSHRPELLHDSFFHDLVTAWCGPHNKFVFMDAHTRSTVIVNRDKGVEHEGLWLSNTRWFDAQKLGLNNGGEAAALVKARFSV
jgi:hypothetical protein